ncbi:Unknown protein sequence [Pseudomonas coronafaciens pv. oryzae]|nr:Unknown protein sequence [Pseudomonas coronafaciens pv. oryzae]
MIVSSHCGSFGRIRTDIRADDVVNEKLRLDNANLKSHISTAG